MDVRKLIGSKEYKEARSKVEKWKARLEKGSREDAVAVRDEKAEFFAKMRKASAPLYTAFQIDDKTLSEMIFKKLTGKEIMID